MALPGWGQVFGVISSWIGTPTERLRKKVLVLKQKVKEEEDALMRQPQNMRDYIVHTRITLQLRQAEEELASKA